MLRNTLLALAFVLMGAIGTPSLAVTSDVWVYPDSARQTITGMGGNLLQHWLTSIFPGLDSTGAFNLRTLKPTIMRWGIPCRFWEPANDNADPNSFNWTYYAAQDTGAVHSGFLTLQELQRRNIRIICSVFENGSEPWPLWSPSWQEKAECMASYLIYARDHYGVTNVEFVSLNEPHLTASWVSWTKTAGDILDRDGLSVQWLFSDAGGPGNLAVPYADTALADTALMRHCGPISYHNWQQDGVSDALLMQIAAMGKKAGREIWVCEANQSNPYGTYYATQPWKGWTYAFNNAVNCYRSLRYAEANVLLYWDYNDSWSLADSKTNPPTPYPVWYIWKQWMDNLTVGTKVLKATSNYGTILPLASRNDSTGRFMTQVVNSDNLEVTVRLHGLPQQLLTWRRSSATENMVAVGWYSVAKDSILILNLPPKSVNVFSSTLSSDTTPILALSATAADSVIEPYLSTSLSAVAAKSGGIDDTVTDRCLYSSLTPAIAGVYGNTVTGVAAGIARIQVLLPTFQGPKYDTVAIRVAPSTATLDSLKLSLDSLRLMATDSVLLRVTGYYHKNAVFFTKPVDTEAVWTSSDGTVASVTAGRVRGIAAGGPVSVVASLGGKADTCKITIFARLSFLKRINFQVSTVPWKAGWYADNGTAYSVSRTFGWLSTTGLAARDDRSGSNFLLKSFVSPSSGTAPFKIDMPDGSYIIRVGMGDNSYGINYTNMTTVETDTVCFKPAGTPNTIQTDTVSVSSGTGLVLTVAGAINYVVVISNEGVAMNLVADDGSVYVPPLITVSEPDRPALAELLVEPNPFNPSLHITYTLPKPEAVSVAVFDPLGKRVAYWPLQRLTAGRHSLFWNAGLFGSGVYVIHMETPTAVLRKTAVFIK